MHPTHILTRPRTKAPLVPLLARPRAALPSSGACLLGDGSTRTTVSQPQQNSASA